MLTYLIIFIPLLLSSFTITPWDVIEKRLRLAAEADFVVCLYNPRSKGRSEHLAKAFEIMGEFKDGNTPVGIVKDVGRAKEEKFVCTFVFRKKIN